MTHGKHIIGSLLLVTALSSAPIFLSATQNIGSKTAVFPIKNVPIPDSEALIVFTGYIGCGDYCPTSLNKLGTIKKAFSSDQVSVLFLNIVKGTPDKASMDYAKSFHQDFIGYTIKDDEQVSLMQLLGIRSESDQSAGSNHPGRVYLFKRSHDDLWILAKSHNVLPAADNYISEINHVLADA